MLKLRSVLRRLFPSQPKSKAVIDRLESRQLFSTAPTLTDVHLTGQVHAITSVVLTFSEPLDPTHAQDLQTYLFGKMPAPGTTTNGITLGDILPFLGRPKAALVKSGKIVFSSAAYDDTADTVTLTPLAPFNGQKFIRRLRVKGTGAHALQDPSGNVLNNGADSLVLWTKLSGKSVSYAALGGDRVTLKLRGPGTIYVFRRASGDPDPLIFVDRVTAASSLTGFVKQGRHGTGVASIDELQGASGITNNVFNTSQFAIASSES